MTPRARMMALAAMTALAGCGMTQNMTERMGTALRAAPQEVDGIPLDPKWQARFPADTPHVNVSGDTIPVYAGPKAEVVTGTLPATEGGYVTACVQNGPWCRIAYADGASGWVNMGQMGTLALSR